LRSEPALHELDCDPAGFEWIDCNNTEESTVAILRKGISPDAKIVAVFNFTPVPRQNYRIGVPEAGYWREILNSDSRIYGGSGWGNLGGVEAAPVPAHGRRFSVHLNLPPLGALFLKPAAR
jgi:1,4-alpha-glucan branching enzyme